MNRLDNTERKQITTALWAAVILSGGIQAWAHRFTLSSQDSVAYLDIADAYFRGDWQTALSPYWSPLYSWILGLFLTVLRPAPVWELQLINAVNFLILVLTAFSFTFLLREYLVYHERRSGGSRDGIPFPPGVLMAMMATLFVWSSVAWITVRSDTPDMITAAVLYLAAALVLRFYTGRAGRIAFPVLGAVLGAGFLAKTIMLPMALVFFAAAFWGVEDRWRKLPRLAAGLAVFLAIIAPFVLLISMNEGRLTYGDSGRLNYVWFVNPGEHIVPDQHWQGGPAGFGEPLHPTRQIFESPPVYEFEEPIGGTYPAWTNPSYWMSGVVIEFNAGKQLRLMWINLGYYLSSFPLPILIALFGLVLLAGGARHTLGNLKAGLPLLLPALCGLGAYGLVLDLRAADFWEQPVTRYLSPLYVLFAAGLLITVELPDRPRSRRLLLTLAAVTLLVMGAGLVNRAREDLVYAARENAHTHWDVARGLRDLGYGPGSTVAVGSYATDLAWARLARVTVGTEVCDFDGLITGGPELREDVVNAIRQTGSDVLVLNTAVPPEGWVRLGSTRYYAYPLRSTP